MKYLKDDLLFRNGCIDAYMVTVALINTEYCYEGFYISNSPNVRTCEVIGIVFQNTDFFSPIKPGFYFRILKSVKNIGGSFNRLRTRPITSHSLTFWLLEMENASI